MIIKQFARCAVIQANPGSYRVQSTNNVCLFETQSPSSAMEYAEWFERHYFALPKVLWPEEIEDRLPMGDYHPGDYA